MLSNTKFCAHRARALLSECRCVPLRQPVRRVITYSNTSSGVQTAGLKQRMTEQVHKWFASLAADDHPVEDFLRSDAWMTDHLNEACYKGYAAMKHRMQAVHEKLPHLVEVSEVTDLEHNCVAAHWVAHEATEDVSGTYIFRFDDAGMIAEITVYADDDEEEYPEA